MTPAEFLDTVVKPNRTELSNDFSNLRLAFNAIASVDALAAHLFRWLRANGQDAGATTDGDYRQKLADRSDEFTLIRDIAKAQKHVELTFGKPRVQTADQVSSKPIGWGEGAFGQGRYGGPKQVVVYPNDGELEYVESLLDGAIKFLEEEMRLVGALP